MTEKQKNENWQEFRFIDLFAGIGGLRIPFDELGGHCVFSSEWDKYAQMTYEANFDETPYGDITKISLGSIPNHEILIAGFPCQTFSIIRKGASYSYLLVNGVRRPSSRELLRLQGFPETFKIVVSHAEIRKQTGNSVPIPVVRHIAKQMIKSLKERVLQIKPHQLSLNLTIG